VRRNAANATVHIATIGMIESNAGETTSEARNFRGKIPAWPAGRLIGQSDSAEPESISAQ
jgi:hypothetical protein